MSCNLVPLTKCQCLAELAASTASQLPLHSAECVPLCDPGSTCVHQCINGTACVPHGTAGTTWRPGSPRPAPTASSCPAPTAQTTRYWYNAAGGPVVPNAHAALPPTRSHHKVSSNTMPQHRNIVFAPPCSRGGWRSGCAPRRRRAARPRRSTCTCSTARCRVRRPLE